MYRLNLFLPYLRRPKRDRARELPRPFKSIALQILPAPVFSQAALSVNPGPLRRFLKVIGPTWLSAPIRRLIQTLCFLTFLWLFFYICWPYTTIENRNLKIENFHPATFL